MLKKKFFSYEFLKNIKNNFLKDAEVFTEEFGTIKFTKTNMKR